MLRQSNGYAYRRRPLLFCFLLTTNLLLTFSKINFSLRAMDSPFLFFILFFSSFLQAYIFPVALTWQAHTWGEKIQPKWYLLHCDHSNHNASRGVIHFFFLLQSSSSLTSPNPPFPSTLYCLNVSLVIGCLTEHRHSKIH